MKKLSSSGKCLCGGVSFNTKGYHRDISNCHCIQCMKTHGNFAAYTNIEDKFLLFKSKKTLKWFNSSRKAKRGFCNKCGASIFFKFKNSKTTSISAGMFSKSLKLKSSKNIFVKNRLKFYKVDNSMPKFNRYSNK
jgi:hypothetical protein